MQEWATHGGSLRIFACHSACGQYETSTNVAAILEKERKHKQTRISILIASIVVVLSTALILSAVLYFIPNSRYNAAIALRESGQYDEAIEAFTALGDCKDSAEQIEDLRNEIEELRNETKYSEGMMLTLDYS